MWETDGMGPLRVSSHATAQLCSALASKRCMLLGLRALHGFNCST